MKIFRRHYYLRLSRTRHLPEIIKILQPWTKEVIYKDSPLLRQIASYKLRICGSSYAPRIYKNTVGNEILRLTGEADLYSILNLSIVEAFREYDPSKGAVDLISWMSWRIPYIAAKYVYWRSLRPVPETIYYESKEIDEFEENDMIGYLVDITSKEANVDNVLKLHYKSEIRRKNDRSPPTN